MLTVPADQAAAFRLGRQNLDERRALPLAEAARCPASDFQRGSALLALAARSSAVTREDYDRATDAGELVLGPSLRAAIHAVAPDDLDLYGRALVSNDDEELGEQLGDPLRAELRAEGIAPTDALREVAEATAGALAGGRTLSKDELHAELRGRVRSQLLPWCRGCQSHHVAPMLWRFAGVEAGMRLDSRRRYRLDRPGGRAPAREPLEAVRRFLSFYGPATERDLAAWGGLARRQARRLWSAVHGELEEVRVDGGSRWLLAEDAPALGSPPRIRGLRLLPPRDPYLQHPDRASVVAGEELRKRLYRPVGGPGAVLQDGRVAGLWRARTRGRALQVDIEPEGPIDPEALEAEAARVAQLRGAQRAAVAWG